MERQKPPRDLVGRGWKEVRSNRERNVVMRHHKNSKNYLFTKKTDKNKKNKEKILVIKKTVVYLHSNQTTDRAGSRNKNIMYEKGNSTFN